MEIIRTSREDKSGRRIRRAVLERELKCPCCGAWREELWDDDFGDKGIDLHRGSVSVSYMRCKWYGQKSGAPYLIKWGKDLRYWEQYIYSCEKCGAAWMGDVFSVEERKKRARRMNF